MKSNLDILIEEAKAAPGPNIFQKIYWAISSFVWKIRYLLQKIFRSYHLSNLELFDLDVYLSKLISKKLKAFKASARCSFPCSVESFEEWDKILDKMIYGFDYFLYTDFDIDKYSKAQEGIDLFAKHFGNLWD